MTVPRSTVSPAASTVQSNSTRRFPAVFSRTVTVARTRSPTRMTPLNSSCCETMRVPGPGSLRSSMPEMMASAATASTHRSLGSTVTPSTRLNGTTSPETSSSASISVWPTTRSALAVAPISISSNVTLL